MRLLEVIVLKVRVRTIMMRWGKKKDKTWMRMMTMIMRMRDGINKQMIYSDYDD